MSAYGLKDYEVRSALGFLMNYLDMETRGRMMLEFPEIYNKLCGSEIMLSVHKKRLEVLEALEDCDD